MSKPEHLDRVIAEKAALDEKRDALLRFMSTTTFRELDQGEQDRMRSQYGVMGLYSEILLQRLSAWRAS
jgi:hypothetical protein